MANETITERINRAIVKMGWATPVDDLLREAKLPETVRTKVYALRKIARLNYEANGTHQAEANHVTQPEANGQAGQLAMSEAVGFCAGNALAWLNEHATALRRIKDELGGWENLQSLINLLRD